MHRWAAFRRYLTNFSSLPDAPFAAVVVWQQYLVYAVALGAPDRVERQVRALVPESQMPSPWPGVASGDGAFRSFHGLYSAPMHSLIAAAYASFAGRRLTRAPRHGLRAAEAAEVSAAEAAEEGEEPAAGRGRRPSPGRG
jgi:uncharacterized membrane protein